MRWLSVVVAVVLGSGLFAVPAFGEEARLREAIRQAPVARETNAGYDRDKFDHWVDVERRLPGHTGGGPDHRVP